MCESRAIHIRPAFVNHGDEIMQSKRVRIAFGVFLMLLIIFLGAWVIKSKTPAMRPNINSGTVIGNGAWWNVKPEDNRQQEKWVMDPEIPDNYLPVPEKENLYMVIGENNQILKYRERTKQADGSWLWKDTNPDIPDHYTATNLKGIYKVTDKSGNESYFKYVRNEDDTFAFVPTDKNGQLLNDSNPTGDTIPKNYMHISGDIYAVKDSNDVVIQYKERKKNEDGTYTWSVVSKPENSTSDSTDSASNKKDNVKIDKKADGSYTETETIINTQISGGWKITYQTLVKRNYDAQGNLVSTQKEGPIEIKREQSNG